VFLATSATAQTAATFDRGWSAGVGHLDRVRKDLALYWSFRSGGTNPVDEVTARNDTQASGAIDSQSGVFGAGHTTVAGSGRMETSIAITTTPNHTYCAWVRPTSITASTRFMIGYSGNAQRGPGTILNKSSGDGVRLSSTSVVAGLGWTVDVKTIGLGYSTTVYTHVAGVIDDTAGTAYIYVNGTLRTSTVANASTVTSKIYVSATSANAGTIEGSIDEVRIYNRALSADDVRTLYQLGSWIRGYR